MFLFFKDFIFFLVFNLKTVLMNNGSSCFEEKLSGSHHLQAGSKKHRNRLQGQCPSSGPNQVVHLLAWHYQRRGPNPGGVYHLGTSTIENENETLYKRYMNPPENEND